MNTENGPMPSVEKLHPDCWRELDDRTVQLIAYRCTRCGTHYLPHVLMCTACGCDKFDRVDLSPIGLLYTYTIVRGAGGVWPSVYAVGYVDFPEGVRVFGHLREVEPEHLKVGAKVRVEPALIYKRKDGTGVTAFRFTVTDGDAR